MTLYEQYHSFLNTFCLNHKEQLQKLTRFENRGDTLDYVPSYEQRSKPNFDKSTLPENNPLVQEFVEKTYSLIWGKEDAIQISLNGHFPQYDGKTLKEINEMDNKWGHLLFTRDFLKNALINQVIYDLVNISIFDGKDIYSPFLVNPKRPDIVSGGLNLWESTRCSFCDKPMNFEYNHIDKIFTYRSIKVDETACIHTHFNGNNVYSFTINVPSKKLVFMNDIRSVFNVDREDEYTVSLNSVLGKKRECEVYAENNMAYFFVSNTSPSIYQNEEQIVIDPFNIQFKIDEKLEEPVISDGYIEKGYICTDLWAVCMADYDDFLKRCTENEINVDDFDIVVVDVPNNKVDVDYNFDNYLITIKH